MKSLDQYACAEAVEIVGFTMALTALENALCCDAFPEELNAAARAADSLGDELELLARRLREAAR